MTSANDGHDEPDGAPARGARSGRPGRSGAALPVASRAHRRRSAPRTPVRSPRAAVHPAGRPDAAGPPPHAERAGLPNGAVQTAAGPPADQGSDAGQAHRPAEAGAAEADQAAGAVVAAEETDAVLEAPDAAADAAEDAESDDPEEARSGGMFRSLRTRNYRLYAMGQVISNTGTWMQRVAQDWLVLDLAHNNGTALGITTGLQFLPLLLFGLWGGVIADRYRKRRVLMITQVSMGALALILGVLTVTGNAQVWHVYLLAFGLGLATVVDNPTRQSFVIEMVGKRDLPNAIALNSATFNGARLLGPAVAGVLIAVIGTGPVFLVNAASFGAVLLGLYAMRESELHDSGTVKRAKGQLREGLRYVRGRRDLVLVLVMVGFVATFGMNFQMTTALVAKEVFHTGASSFGLASSMLALGALTGALLAARRVTKPRLRLLVLAAMTFGVMETAAGLAPTYWSFLVLLVPAGIALMTFTTSANATMQLGVQPEMRGRVMGLYMFVFMGTNPLGAPTVGWMAEQFGPRLSIVLGGLVSMAIAVVVAALAAPRGSIRPALARLARVPAAGR
ncbi:MFS transporter [Actinomadura nitritigenes]